MLTLQAGATPLQRYLCGYLEPAKKEAGDVIESVPMMEGTQASSAEEESQSSTAGDELGGLTMLSPSSMGISVHTQDATLDIEARWGEYRHDEPSTWTRSPHSWKHQLVLTEGEENLYTAEGSNIRMQARMRKEEGGGS